MTWTISFLLSIHLLLALGQWGGAGVYITTWIIMICTYWVMCLNIQPSYFHFYSFKGPCPDYFHCYCFNVTCNCNLQLEKTAQWESLLLIRDFCVWHLHTMVVRDWGRDCLEKPTMCPLWYSCKFHYAQTDMPFPSQHTMTAHLSVVNRLFSCHCPHHHCRNIIINLNIVNRSYHSQCHMIIEICIFIILILIAN